MNHDALIPLFRAAQVREFDRIAIEDLGTPGYQLMTRAGEAAFAWLRKHWPHLESLYVVCGGGNNAGDGYVLARLAHLAGMTVEVGYLRAPGSLAGDAATAWREAEDAGVSCQPFAVDRLADFSLIADALLGTGLERPLADDWLAAVQAINATPAPVLALDIPSGLHADNGAMLGAAVQADVTVTFIARKLGLYTGEGPACCGMIRFDDLGVPETVMTHAVPAARMLSHAWLRPYLPQRRRNAHKGDFGHVLVIGGQPGMGGAARLAGEAAIRSGAGLVSVATHPEHAAMIAAARPELMARGIDGGDALEALLKSATVLALGPGLGQEDWGTQLWSRAVNAGRPLVVDADGLNLLAHYPEQRDDWILTPHPGEAARLLGCSTAEIQADRPAAARAIQAKFGGVTVLKGAGTLITDGEQLLLSPAGNPGMASGGMGDVLTGILAGLLAQGQKAGLSALTVAAMAVYLHGAVGDHAARQGGERGLLAGDLLAALRPWMNPHD